MTEPNIANSPKQGAQENRKHWYLILVALLIGASLFAPDLAWVFFGVFLVSVAGYLLLGRSNEEVPSRVLEEAQLKAGKTAHLVSHQPLVEALQFPAYILDSQGHVIFANSSSRGLFGRTSPGEKIFIQFRQPEFRAFVEQALASQGHLTGEYNESIPDDRWFGIEIAPIQNEFGENAEPNFFLGFHDWTEAKRTDQMRSDFIANASHELRTPLASLLGYIETIKGPARKDDKAIDRFTDVMLDQAQRMTRLVNDLLSLSRIEMQSHVRPSEKVNLSEIVSSVVDSIGGVASQLKVKIEFENPGNVPILGDRDELLQVFENLIENACKYGAEGGKVEVSIDKDMEKHQVTVSVKDFGPGIALEHQQRITERFYRVDVESSREKQGTGLGLAIVKHILNRHATKLGVESSPDEGARFFVTFPIED